MQFAGSVMSAMAETPHPQGVLAIADLLEVDAVALRADVLPRVRELIVTGFFGLGSGQYRHYFNLFLPPIDILYSFIKALLFAMVVTLIHCYYGFYAAGGPRGVGIAAGRAMRASITAMVVTNMFLTMAFWGIDAGGRLGG